jgi:hypothetical protein
MKHLFTMLVCAVLFFQSNAQLSYQDSLKGFNTANAVLQAYERGFADEEAKTIVKREQREYLVQKFKLYSSVPPAKKYSTSQVANAPCLNEDFEAYSPGVYSSGLDWSISAEQNISINTAICGTMSTASAFTVSPPYNSFAVATTPITDAKCNNVPHSPLGGSNIAVINKHQNLNYATRVAQTFSVTTNNCYYYYAYLAVLENGGHACCDHCYATFNFYNCTNNLIAALSRTCIPPSSNSVCTNVGNWSTQTISSSLYMFNSGWEVCAANLSPYIGSCITVEVIVSNCAGAGHYGYCYYDAKCSSSAIAVNGNFLATTSYTSCSNTATISAPAPYSNYSWQGPVSSGVTGSTNSFVTTGVSGIYSLTASTGSVTMNHTVNVTVNTLAGVSITAPSNTICSGSSMILQASAPGATSYSWSSSAVSSTILIVPVNNVSYSVTTTNSLGCTSIDSKTIVAVPLPTIQLIPSSPTLCVGQSVNLMANVSGASSFSWSTGSTNTVITVSPITNSVYAVSAINSSACVKTDSITLNVYSNPQPGISVSSFSLCEGNSLTLLATGANLMSYTWSPGNNTSSISISPTITSVYSLSVTNFFGCSGSTSSTFTVHPKPLLQLTANNNTICLGHSAVLTASSNTSNYLWNTGSTAVSVQVSPTLTSVYSVSVTSTQGCKNSSSVSISVLPSPQFLVLASDTLVCPGAAVTLSANVSSNTYTWSNGAIGLVTQVTPLVNSVYSATTTGTNGCTTVRTKTIELIPTTPIVVNATHGFTICEGESIQLNANTAGVISYTWNTGVFNSIINVSPLSTTIYTVSGLDVNNFCKTSATPTIVVDPCTGIDHLNVLPGITILPNPATDSFVIKGSKSQSCTLINELGQLIKKFELTSENKYSYTISGLAEGVYFVRTEQSSSKVIVK